MIHQRACRAGIIALGSFLLLGWPGRGLHAQAPIERFKADLPVTNGLIRWWPNLFDARDEVTGEEGVVMGVLPPVRSGSADETEFGRHTGWVQLQPTVTNEVFTLSLWLLWRPQGSDTRLLGQQSGDVQWFFQTEAADNNFLVGQDQFEATDRLESVSLLPDRWHHLAVARRSNGTSVVWVDGVRSLDGRIPHPWPREAQWLTVGNIDRGGDQEFHGQLRDLCVFDRVLADEEAQALHSAGLPKRVARCSAARLAATRREVPTEISTNLVVVPERDWMHRRFTTEDGLPGNEVKAVLQAKNGYLWVGTEAGLARFDGRQFRTFTAENTAALRAIGQTVWSLSEDTDGTIWAGVFGGLLRIRNLEFTAFTNGLPQRFILHAEPAGDGSLWVAGFNDFLPRGPCWLRRYHPHTQSTSAAVIVPGHIRRLIAITNGVWIASEQPQQMHFWDGQSSATTVIGTVGREPGTVRLAQQDVLPRDVEVRVWRAGSSFPSPTWAEVSLSRDGPILAWVWDPGSWRPRVARWAGPAAPDHWMGVLHNLGRVVNGLLERVDTSPQASAPEITCVCGNREGGVWFGTEEDGLHFVQERLIRVYTTQDGLAGNDVRSVCTTPQGGLWVTGSEGLSQWQDRRWTVHGRGPLRGISSDHQGRPWLGLAEFGYGSLMKDTNWFPVFLDLEWQDPNSLLFARDGTLWVACERGLTWLQPERLVLGSRNRWVPDPTSDAPAFGRFAVGHELPRLFPLGLVEDRDGSIWMGSLAGGLVQVRAKDILTYSKEAGLPGLQAVPRLCDAQGALWIISEKALTRRLAGRFQSCTDRDGLPRDSLLDLIEDDIGNFWISGKRGIHRLARRDVEDFFAGRVSRVRSFTLGARDGLLTPECSSLHYPAMAKTPDHRIWVATRRGIATFDPSQVHLDTQPLQTVIERFLVNRQEVLETLSPNSASALRLPPGSGQRLEFHYTATSLLAADRVRFRYWLEHYEADWSPETDLRLAFYTNLRPGPYRFHVKAVNAHGVWNDQDTVLSFAILPYFWQTTLFYIVCGVALASAAAAVHFRRLTRQRRLHELRHLQELTTEKARIAADMHDELGAALTQIAILGEVAKNQAGDQKQTRSTLDRISKAAREVTSRMSELVWATNPRNDTLDNLVAYLREHAASQFENTAIGAHLEFPTSVPDRHVSATFRRNISLILNESLHNVIKHSGASEVVIQVACTDSALALRVRDNGHGFDTTYPKTVGNGLGNMAKRVKDLDGAFSLKSAPRQGTQIEISVPLLNTKALR